MATERRTMLDSRRNIALACALSALAGYVDGIGFLHLGGLFVSFMSGNSTRMGVSLAEGQWLSAAEAFGLIALFVIGAAAGSLIVLGRGTNRQPWLLLAEAALTGGARWGWVPNLLLWAAMVMGSLCGALAYYWINLAAIWFAAGAALALSAILAATTHR